MTVHHYCNALLLASVLCTSTWAASPIYVSSASGSDTNNGESIATPVQSLTKAYELVDSSGTLVVAAGTYTQSLVLSKPVIIEGANAGISPNGGTRVAESIITVDGPVITIAAGADGSVVDGLKFTGTTNDPGDGIIFGNQVSDVTIMNNIIDGNSGHGIRVIGAQRWLIEDNLIQNVTGASRSGMFLLSFQHSTVKSNTLKNLNYAGMICDSHQDTVIENNTIDNCSQPGIQVANSAGPVLVTKNHISLANTANGADKAAISIYPNTPLIDVTYNTLINSNGAFSVRGQAGTVAATVHVNNNNLLGNTTPQVKNRAQGGGLLDATNNWWGTATGPSSADLAESNVDLDPWLSSEAAIGDWMNY